MSHEMKHFVYGKHLSEVKKDDLIHTTILMFLASEAHHFDDFHNDRATTVDFWKARQP